MDHKLQAKTMVHPFPVVTEQVFCSVIYIHTYFPVILQQLCLEKQKICKQIKKKNQILSPVMQVIQQFSILHNLIRIR